MPVHDPPAALFGSEDARNPQRSRYEFLATADFGSETLHLNQVGKLTSHAAGGGLKSGGAARSVVGRGPFHDLGNLRPSLCYWAKRICEGGILPMRIQRLRWLWIAPEELVQRNVVLPDKFVEARRGHL